MQRTFHGLRAIGGALLFLAWVFGSILQQTVAAPPAAFMLDLPDGGVLPGTFAPSDAVEGITRKTFRWKAAPFVDPFDFRLDAITGIRAATAVKPPEDLTGFRCRLRGGDIIDGILETIDADAVVLRPIGNDAAVRIDRSIVTSIRRRGPKEGAGYVGPGSLVGWKQEPADSWQDEAARLSSSRRNASISKDLEAPPRARYDIVLSWRTAPEFVVAVNAGESRAIEPYRFEILEVTPGGRTGMVARHVKGPSGLEEIAIPPLPQDRMRLSLFVDSAVGRLAVAIEGSDRIVETTAPPGNPVPPQGQFRLSLLSGDVCLESIRVTEWTSPDPRAEERPETTVVTRDGRGAVGAVTSLDAAEGTVVVTGDEGDATMRLDDLEAIEFPVEAESRPDHQGAVVAEAVPTIRVISHGGVVITGDLVAATEKEMLVVRRGITGPMTVRLAEVQTVAMLTSSPPHALPERAGTLVIGDARVPGCIVDAAAWGGGIAWLPTGSLVASGFRDAGAGLSAVVEYVSRADQSKESSSSQAEIGGVGASISVEDGEFVIGMIVEDGAAARDGRIQPGDRILAVRPTKDGPIVETKGLDPDTVMDLLRGRVGTPVGVRVATPGGKPRTVSLIRGLIYVADREILDRALAAHVTAVAVAAAAKGQAGFPAIVALVSGDLVPAAVERIDDKGVWLRSPVTAEAGSEAVVVADSLVKAIELDPTASTKGIPRDRFERLLTVPRSQQSDPPTHLVRLRSGDYLRGKLVGLDETQVTFEVLGQKKKLPRNGVVRLIWLHPGDLEAGDEKAGTEKAVKNKPGNRELENGKQPPTNDGKLLVQGVASGGQRTTLEAERVDGRAIIGRSPAFGSARIDTAHIDRLLVGGTIADADEGLPFAKWRLRLAPVPRALREKK